MTFAYNHRVYDFEVDIDDPKRDEWEMDRSNPGNDIVRIKNKGDV